jgi:hypothetical protein
VSYILRTDKSPPNHLFNLLRWKGVPLLIQVKIGPNSLTGANFGFLQVDFENTHNSIRFNVPAGYTSGIAYRDRMCYVDGVQWFVDTKNKLVGEMVMSTS